MRIYRTILYSTLGFLFFIVLVFGITLTFQERSETMKVTFLDVGQGDAILISEGSYQVLIDGGRNGQLLLEQLGRSIPFWDRTIEVVVATHPDQDHIGGLIDVVQSYRVKNILATHARSDSGVFDRWSGLMDENQFIDTYQGLVIRFPSGAVLETLYPHGSLRDGTQVDTNETSVVMQLTYNETQFLFTGDLSVEGERQLMVEDIDVLKVGHHGSKTSTDEDFLGLIRPEQAIISAGEDNRYGHPHIEVVDRLRRHGAKVIETSEMGNIQYVCEKEKEACNIRFY